MKLLKLKFKQMPLVLAIMFFIISFSAFIVLLTTIHKKYDKAQEVEQNLRTEEFKRKNISEADIKIKTYQDQISELEKHFIYSSDIVPFLNALEDIGRALNIEVVLSQVDSTKDGKSILVNLNSKGSFENMYKLLSLVENSKYELKVLSTRLSVDSNPENGSSVWSADLQLQLLSFLP